MNGRKKRLLAGIGVSIFGAHFTGGLSLLGIPLTLAAELYRYQRENETTDDCNTTPPPEIPLPLLSVEEDAVPMEEKPFTRTPAVETCSSHPWATEPCVICSLRLPDLNLDYPVPDTEAVPVTPWRVEELLSTAREATKAFRDSSGMFAPPKPPAVPELIVTPEESRAFLKLTRDNYRPEKTFVEEKKPCIQCGTPLTVVSMNIPDFKGEWVLRPLSPDICPDCWGKDKECGICGKKPLKDMDSIAARSILPLPGVPLRCYSCTFSLPKLYPFSMR